MNDKVLEFINKAQSKIGEIGGLIVGRRQDYSLLSLSDELIDVIEALTDCNNDWDEHTTNKVIDFYNKEASLNDIPYVQIVGYEVHSVGSVIQVDGVSSVNDLVDYIQRTTELILSTKHNQLKEIQGGKVGEYYHVDKKMYDWIISQVYPFVAPVVSLSITTPTSKIIEKGTSIPRVVLQGGATANSGKKVLRTRYYRGSNMLVENQGETINQYTDNNVVKETIVYKFQADFEEGGMKEATSTIQFVLPYYSEIRGMGELVPGGILATSLPNKVLGTKPSQVNVTFVFPEGNATSKEKTAALYIPKSYGVFTKIYVDNNPMFDYINDWERLTVNMLLPDLTSEEYYVYRFKVATEGTFNFNFKWQ